MFDVIVISLSEVRIVFDDPDRQVIIVSSDEGEAIQMANELMAPRNFKLWSDYMIAKSDEDEVTEKIDLEEVA